MKKRIFKTICCGMLICSALALLSGCGNDSVEIKKDQAAAAGGALDVETAALENAGGRGVSETYTFTVNGFQISPDMDMGKVLAAIGKEETYYEAPSCAFQGLDKIYTYPDFEIDTYPQGEKDLISVILLKDDLVKTDEGIRIGDSVEEVLSAYPGAKEESGSITLSKGNMQLLFLDDGQSVTSIQYKSLAAQ